MQISPVPTCGKLYYLWLHSLVYYIDVFFVFLLLFVRVCTLIFILLLVISTCSSRATCGVSSSLQNAMMSANKYSEFWVLSTGSKWVWSSNATVLNLYQMTPCLWRSFRYLLFKMKGFKHMVTTITIYKSPHTEVYTSVSATAQNLWA